LGQTPAGLFPRKRIEGKKNKKAHRHGKKLVSTIAWGRLTGQRKGAKSGEKCRADSLKSKRKSSRKTKISEEGDVKGRGGRRECDARRNSFFGKGHFVEEWNRKKNETKVHGNEKTLRKMSQGRVVGKRPTDESFCGKGRMKK